MDQTTDKYNLMNKLIYVADDDRNIRLAIKVFLESQGYQVKEFETGRQVLEAFEKQPCDLLLLDVMMPEIDGFEVCRRIRKKSYVPIIMLTALDTDMDYASGINLGGDDYFTKPFSVAALSMRVKAIFRRIEYEKQRYSQMPDQDCAKPSVRLGSVIINRGQHRVFSEEEELYLTPNEFELLYYLACHCGEAVSREELLEQVWGYKAESQSRATDDTVRRLRKKLEDTDLTIETVWGYGFRLNTVPKGAER